MVSRQILSYMREREGDIIALIKRFVETESPTGDKAAVDRMGGVVADAVEDVANVTRLSQSDHGDHLRIEFDVSSRSEGQVLGLGHIDTVWEVGTLGRMPWKQEGGRLWGPGVFDMKAGVAYLIFAARALRDLGLQSRRGFVVQLNSDEEIGSPSSTPHTREEAARSAAVLVAEPSAGLEGNLKTSRKGGATFEVSVDGVATHAGLDFAAGASAILEICRQIQATSSWTDLEKGVTVNPGLVRGGSASNVVAEHAWAEFDARFVQQEQGIDLERRFASLVPVDPRCTVSVSGGVRKPPLERTPDVVRLFECAKAISAELGVELGEASVGGGSDGNTTAAMGIPTLDGIGAVGEGAHALHESILVDRIADRAALIASLVQTL